MITLMLVDDHDIVRLGVKRLLQDVAGFKVVADANTGEAALPLARQFNPNVILMDVKMPGIGGLEASRKLLRSNPDSKILILTMCEEEPYPSRLLELGVSGYLTKDCSIEELIQAVRATHVGQRYITPRIAQQLALKNVNPRRTSVFDALSERELQIMMMITAGEKIQEISDKLCLSSKTVNTYRYRLFAKLNVNSDVELTHLAFRHGLLTLEPAELQT